MVKNLRPAQSVRCMDRQVVTQQAQLFLNHFPGHSLYAIKANPEVIKAYLGVAA